MTRLQPIDRNLNLTGKTADYLARLIAEGTFKAGERLPAEPALAKSLGVSRPTLREALGSLAARGFLDIRPRSGVFVRSALPAGEQEAILELIEVDREKIWELLEIRRVIDAESAALAAARRTQADLARLRELAREVASLGPTGLIRQKAGGRAYVKFFALLAASTHNTLFEHLREAIDRLVRGALPASRARLARVPGAGAAIQEQLAAILQAVEVGSPAMARRRVVAHLTALEGLLRKAFEVEAP